MIRKCGRDCPNECGCSCDTISESITKKLYAIAFIIVLAIGCVDFFHKDERKYIVGVHPWCPYVCMESHDNLHLNTSRPGYLVEIFNAFAKQENIKFEYKDFVWHEAIRSAYSGKVDVILGATHEEAEDLNFNKVALGEQELCFWGSVKNKWHYNGPESLKMDSKLVVEQDVSLDFLRDYILKNHVELVLSDFINSRDLVYKLALGGYDEVLVVNSAFLDDLATIKDGDRIVENKGCAFSQDVFYAFSRNVDPEFIEKFDKFYVEYKKTPEFLEMMKRYPTVKIK